MVVFDPSYASKLFPNPTQGTLYIDMESYMGMLVEVMVTDQVGKMLMSQSFDQEHERTVNMDLTKL